MKVLMFGWEFPPHISGGLGTACYGLTKGLSHFDLEMIFVVPKSYGDEDQSFLKIRDAGDVEIDSHFIERKEFWSKLTYLEVESHIKPYISPEAFEILHEEDKVDIEEMKRKAFSQKFKFTGKYGKNLIEEVYRYAVIAAKVATEHDFELIHSHDWLTYPAGIMAKKISGKPLVIHVHATEYDRSGDSPNPDVFKIEKQGMETADRVITVSNLTRRIVIEKYGINPDKVFTVHNAVEPYTYKNIDYTRNLKEKVVTFLGRITFQKGPEYFVEAAKKVLDKDPNVRFVMAGSGDMMNKMIKRAAELGIMTKFHFAGFLKGEDVFKMFSLSDVYVMPSVSEPFGISPLEAMSSNVPVIVSHQSGVSEILTHALKVDFWDVDALADAIYGLLNYKALSESFRKHGKIEVENLKWENAAYKVLQVYKSALK